MKIAEHLFELLTHLPRDMRKVIDVFQMNSLETEVWDEWGFADGSALRLYKSQVQVDGAETSHAQLLAYLTESADLKTVERACIAFGTGHTTGEEYHFGDGSIIRIHRNLLEVLK